MQDKAGPEASLTRQEIEVLKWSAQGKTRRQIARILGVSEHTVKDHLAHACHKLNAANKTQAVAVALARDLLAPNS